MTMGGSRALTVLLCSAWLVVCAPSAYPTAAAETFKPFKLKGVDGVERSLSDVLGKATLVGFFYPSCKYCGAAYPGIQRLYESYKDRGLSVVWINVMPEENRLIAEWRARHGASIPVLIGGRSVQRDYELTMTPTHFLLDSRGRVISKRSGYTAGDEKAIEQEILDALR